MWSSAFSRGMDLPGVPMTAATSSSKSNFWEPGEIAISSRGPVTAPALEK
jgi:hypothetical protein